MKPNNAIYLKCSEESFYRMWIEFLTPFHKLPARARDAAARILLQYFKFKDNVSDPEVLRDVLWSHKSKKDIMDSLRMSPAHFHLILGKLRNGGFLLDNDINPKYIPHKRPGEPRFLLQIAYDWSSPSNPITLPKEDGGGSEE